MKKLVFIFKNMIHFFKTEKLLTILILSGMVVCDVTFLVFGNVFWSDVRDREYRAYNNNFLTFQIGAADMDRFLERTGSRDYITAVFFQHETEAGQRPLIVAAYEPAMEIDRARLLLGQNLSGRPLEFVANANYAGGGDVSGSLRIKKDDVLSFLGDDWVCAGVASFGASDGFDILIGMEDFRSHVEGAVVANFRYKNGTSVTELQEFSNALKDELGAPQVLFPYETIGTGFGEFLYDMRGAILLLLVAVVNDMFLYRFLLTKRFYTYGIYKLYGMDNRLTMLGLFLEMLLFLILTYAVSVLLYLGGMQLLGHGAPAAKRLPEMAFSFAVIVIFNMGFFGSAAASLIGRPPADLARESVVS